MKERLNEIRERLANSRLSWANRVAYFDTTGEGVSDLENLLAYVELLDGAMEEMYKAEVMRLSLKGTTPAKWKRDMIRFGEGYIEASMYPKTRAWLKERETRGEE